MGNLVQFCTLHSGERGIVVEKFYELQKTDTAGLKTVKFFLRIPIFALIMAEMNKSVLQQHISMNLSSFSSNRLSNNTTYLHTRNLRCYVAKI